MKELPISSRYRSTPEVPVTDAEREMLTARLNEAFERGALDADAYRVHLDLVFGARRLGDLVPVVEALPPTPTHAVPAIVGKGSGAPGEVSASRPPSASLVLISAVALIAALAVVLIVVFGLLF